MKSQINEIKKMQRIAGLITESEYQESLINEVDKSALKKVKDEISFGMYKKEVNIPNQIKFLQSIVDHCQELLDILTGKKRNSKSKGKGNLEQDIKNFWDTQQDDAAQSDDEYDAKWDTEFFIDQYPEYEGKEQEIKQIVRKLKIK